MHRSDEYRVDADAVRAELHRVLGSPLFTKSKRCSNVLVYIVERTLVGAEDLRERIIGVQVFGRAPDYDTSQDPTVRVAAAEVRKRLTAYYNQAGIEQELRIELPVHSYVAEFRRPEEKPVVPNPPPTHDQWRSKHRSVRYWSVLAGLALTVIGVAGWATYRLTPPVSALDKFWTPILETPNQVLLCVSSPASTNLTANQASNPPNSSAPELSFGAFTRQRAPYVAMSDVSAADDVGHYLRTRKKDSNFFPANALTMWELRTNPVVIFGTFNNYWATELGANLRFRFNKESDGGKRWIEDANNPGDRSWMLDMSAPVDQVDSDYALISRVLDQSTGQWWIGVAGLTGLGTLAARELLIDPKAMDEVSSGFPKGWQKKNLQIVLGVRLVQGNPGTVHVLAANSW